MRHCRHCCSAIYVQCLYNVSHALSTCGYTDSSVSTAVMQLSIRFVTAAHSALHQCACSSLLRTVALQSCTRPYQHDEYVHTGACATKSWTLCTCCYCQPLYHYILTDAIMLAVHWLLHTGLLTTTNSTSGTRQTRGTCSPTGSSLVTRSHHRCLCTSGARASTMSLMCGALLMESAMSC